MPRWPDAASSGILYLSGDEVGRALASVDVVDAVAAALAAHARGQTVQPQEAHLRWEHSEHPLRSLSMPAAVEGWAGVKIINSNPANTTRGLPRASGLTVLFSIATGAPICVLAGARISCARTAAVTALAVELVAVHPIERLALLGAGALAGAHVKLLRERLPDLGEVRIYDVDPARAEALAADIDGSVLCDSAEQAIRGARLVVPVTTTTSSYIHYDWLEPGSLLVNVSLDDPLPDLVLRADKVFVDDWTLVAADERRLLGRMLRAGRLCGPGERSEGARPIDGELGELLTGTREARTDPGEIILVNPFGLAIEDVAVARRVYEQALRLDLGTRLDP